MITDPIVEQLPKQREKYMSVFSMTSTRSCATSGTRSVLPVATAGTSGIAGVQHAGAAGLASPPLNRCASLPPDKQAEVEDFVDFLRLRAAERELVRASASSRSTHSTGLGHSEDADYDRL